MISKEYVECLLSDKHNMRPLHRDVDSQYVVWECTNCGKVKEGCLDDNRKGIIQIIIRRIKK